jgi:hypothetical protein
MALLVEESHAYAEEVKWRDDHGTAGAGSGWSHGSFQGFVILSISISMNFCG